jgi:hypothetical protein
MSTKPDNTSAAGVAATDLDLSQCEKWIHNSFDPYTLNRSVSMGLLAECRRLRSQRDEMAGALRQIKRIGGRTAETAIAAAALSSLEEGAK